MSDTLWEIDFKKLVKIPADLYNLSFLPHTFNEYLSYKFNLNAWLKKARDRKIAIAIQKQHNLPFRPNWSITRTMIAVRLIALKKKIQNPEPEDDQCGEKEDEQF